MPEPTVLLLSTSDTDLLTARSSGATYRWANPSRLDVDDLEDLLSGADLAVVRILGGYRSWQDGIDAVTSSGVPAVLVSGEQAADAELTDRSTVPAGIAVQTHLYLAHGGVDNLRQLHAFLSDTVLMTGYGFAPPVPSPTWGVLDRPAIDTDGPTIAVLYYRAQQLAGNTGYVEALCRAIENAGGRALPVYCASLRTAEPEMLELLGAADALVVTVLAAGGAIPATATAGGNDDSWNVAHLAALDIPILQGLCLTSPRASWAANADGLTPLDAASQVAVPEFDGRIITVPFSFKEIDDEGLISYVPDTERCARVAGIAMRHARLRRIAPADKRVALVFSAYPTKHARIGNAVGLDTPASAIALLEAMRERGYRLGEVPGLDARDGDALVHALIERGGQDPDWLTAGQLEGNPVRVPGTEYREWFETLPTELQDRVLQHWGQPPGRLFVDRSRDPEGEIVVAAIQSGNVVLMVQPPRGFGDNPVAIYHDPDLPPSHHYLAAYHWLSAGFGADAIVHLGKHGNLEWLPGKTLGMSAVCASDAALGDLPLIYPFLVNDPGEGTQAKRRAHAVLVDHLIPPMARAETYGDIARLEQLLDEHANIAALDPAKLPAIRQQIWTLLSAAKMDHDLGLTERPADEQFDELVLHVDGWLCEIKDVQIRDGLHILGAAPEGDHQLDLVLAILRARQLWAGDQSLPGLREALGLAEDATSDRAAVDAAEADARALVTALQKADWDPAAVDALTDAPQVAAVLRFAATEVVPRLAGTAAEIDQVLAALDGRFIEAGPSGSPLRGLVNVLPTGRNFYSVDPRAVPSRLAAETGAALADSLLTRYRDEFGEWPQSVGLSVWGTSAMRTAGDDIAEVLALLGIRPQWDDASRRVTGLEPIPLAELGRPRIDVTIRISGFFRDAFPHVVTMLDDAVRLAAGLDEPAEDNYVRAHAQADLAEHADERRVHHTNFRLEARDVWRRPAAADRQPRVAQRRRPRRGLHGMGWLRVRPRAGRRAGIRRHAAPIPADRGSRQEHRHARARHRRLRRLLPVPRRHGGHGPRADRPRPGRLHRRQHPSRRGAYPQPVGRDVAGVPGPCHQPAVDGRDAQARVQRRIRDGRDRRLLIRLRRHRGCDGRLDVRASDRAVRVRRCQPQVHGSVQPMGTARNGRAVAGSGQPRHVGAPARRSRRRAQAGAAGNRGRAGGMTTR